MKPSSNPPGHLTQAEHWLRILAETSPAAIFVYRETILFANAAAVELTGFTESELLAMRYEQLLDDAGDPDAGRLDEIVTLNRKDGGRRRIRCHSAYVEMDWQPATLLTAVDVTAQIDAERQLMALQQRFDLAQQTVRWVAWEWFPNSDELRVSSFADTLFGAEVRNELRTGNDYLAMVHPEDRDRVRGAVERLLAGDSDLSLEVRCLTPRGDIRWLAKKGVAQRGTDGRVTRVHGIIQDITEQKITENALFQERDRAFVTLSSIADGVIRTDARGAIDYLNPVAQRLTGWSLAESYGRQASDIYQVVDEETGKRVLDPIQHCLNEQREVVFLGQRLLQRRAGGRFPVHDSAAPIRDRQGRLIGAILVFRDLSQMRQVEEEMQHLASHDPLTGLVNRGEFEILLRDTFAGEPGRKTRKASRKTWGLSGDRLMTQLEMTTSTVSSATGRCSISPRRNSTLSALILRALARALLIMSLVMSTPMTRPPGPTCLAARKQSMPPPEPRSTTVWPGCNWASVTGSPHPNDMPVTSSGSSDTSIS